MVEVIPEWFRKIWEIYNVRMVIIFSLILQIILFWGAPMRKFTGKRWVILLVWSSYFLAEWAASFALGLITSNQSSRLEAQNDLYAFWASFLLLHHAGPDTITAFEENELWLKHLLTLISQVGVTFYVLLETLPRNKLWLPTSLIFLTGIIKYAERTRSLYRVSRRTFRESMLPVPDAGPEYAKLMEASASKKVARLPTTMSQTLDADIRKSKSAFYSTGQQGDQNEKLDESEVVKYAFQFFKIFKGLIVDLISHKDRNESMIFFRQSSAEVAIAVLEVELNFIYEVLYTKFVVIHDLIGYLSRFVSSVSVMVSLGIFFFLDCKNGLDKFDIRVTYILLLGALTLEAIAVFNLIFSDRTIASLANSNIKQSVRKIFNRYLKLRSNSRWSKSVSGFNLITYCLKDLRKKSNEENDQSCLSISKRINHLLHTTWRYFQTITHLLNYESKKHFTEEQWKIIFEELLNKSKQAENPEESKRISSARGAYVLQELVVEVGTEVCRTLITDYIENVTYDESLLLWHIATEICHGREDNHETKANQGPDKNRGLSKLLSDYMLYLFVMKPTMMSNVTGIGDIRYRDTCAEAKRFFSNKGLGRGQGPNQEKKACENLLGVNTDVKPIYVKGDKSKSVLFDACMLAKELQKLEAEKKWEVISKVWVEMLSYASNQCRPDAHVQQVCRGGQLITFVWLLMAHFGLVDQFIFTTGFGPAKLIAEE